MICLPELEEVVLKVMVKKIFDWGFANYVDKVKFEINNLVNICHAIYKSAAKKFLPLPRKSHYLFNLRDLMKIVASLLSVPTVKYEATADNRTKLLRLFIHETSSIYSDRLVDNEDKEAFE